MRRLFPLFLGCALLLAPHGLSREPLPYHSVQADSTAAEPLFLPEVSVAQHVASEEKECAVPADIAALSPSAQDIFHKALQHVPCDLIQSLRVFDVMNDADMPRALAGSYTLKIRSDLPQRTKEEFTAVLIHELGHIIDLGGLRGTPQSGRSEFQDGAIPIFEDDPSLDFYRISWQSSFEKKDAARLADFVSGYAEHDVFEDFSETLLFYRLHGTTFRALAVQNPILQQKYDFFKNSVFAGEEFDGGTENVQDWEQPWDVTKL